MLGRFSLVCLLAISSLLVASPGEAQLVLYDDFSVNKINPAKWFGGETNRGPMAPNTEILRKVALGQAQLLLTSFGRTDTDTGTAGFAENRLNIPNPAAVVEMQATVTAKAATAQGCAANSTATRARARIIGGFFNDGTSPGPGNRTGDIIAGIQKVRDSILGIRIEAFISRCTAADCVTSTTLASHAFTATWTSGVPDVLRMEWDQAASQFHFALNPETGAQETVSLSYAVSDANPPVVDFRNISILHTVASCTAGQRKASLTGLFDNVMVNP
jgi:hypothetical protein